MSDSHFYCWALPSDPAFQWHNVLPGIAKGVLEECGPPSVLPGMPQRPRVHLWTEECVPMMVEKVGVEKGGERAEQEAGAGSSQCRQPALDAIPLLGYFSVKNS